MGESEICSTFQRGVHTGINVQINYGVIDMRINPFGMTTFNRYSLRKGKSVTSLLNNALNKRIENNQLAKTDNAIQKKIQASTVPKTDQPVYTGSVIGGSSASGFIKNYGKTLGAIAKDLQEYRDYLLNGDSSTKTTPDLNLQSVAGKVKEATADAPSVDNGSGKMIVQLGNTTIAVDNTSTFADSSPQDILDFCFDFYSV